VYLLHIETSSFNFHVIGRSAEETKEAFRDFWPTHCENTGADPDYIDILLEQDPIYITPGFVSVDHSEAPRA